MSNTNATLTPEQISEFKTSLDKVQSTYTSSIKSLLKGETQETYEELIVMIYEEIYKDEPLHDKISDLSKSFLNDLRITAFIHEEINTSMIPEVKRLNEIIKKVN